MNLNYVKNYLEERRDNITLEDIDNLLAEIKEYQSEEESVKDIAKVMRTVQEYVLTYLIKVEEYEVVPTNDITKIPERAQKVRSILTSLSLLTTYLNISLAQMKNYTDSSKSIRDYMSDMAAKKEHYKSEKMSWIVVLKSLTQEMDFAIDMRKYDLEDSVGYLSVKEKREKSLQS